MYCCCHWCCYLSLIGQAITSSEQLPGQLLRVAHPVLLLLLAVAAAAAAAAAAAIA
jgi:hypothetical protein